jgi:tetratricopeptide (TPR) repeat protein
MAASARLELNDPVGVVRDLKEIAAELTEKGRPGDAIEALRAAAELVPDDEGIRQQLLQAYIAAGDFVRAMESAATAEQFVTLAGALELAGHADAALQALVEATRLNPDDGALRAQLARALVARGDLQRAAEHLTAEVAGDDPQLLLTAAEIKLRGERVEEGVELARRLLAQYPERRDELAFMGWSVAEGLPDAGFKVVDLATDAAVEARDWPSAAATLQEFVTRVPNYIPALMRLVEICVDGALEATMYSAQAQLADAYLAAGRAAEARFIAEDLVAREPWERAHLERFKRALELLGEADPDGLIAERLSGQSPFTATDLFSASEFPPVGSIGVSSAADPGGAPEHFGLGANAIDLESILGELEPSPPATAHATSESVEVDLSIVLSDMRAPAPPVPGPAPAPAPSPAAPGDIEQVFAQLRDEASRRSPMEAAEAEYVRALELEKSGDMEECVRALQLAARAPRVLFAAASKLGRIHRQRGQPQAAAEWLERAAQAPAPTPEELHALLYELADVLEEEGEIARALAVCMELQAEAGSYRDVDERIEWLMKVQTGG